MWLLIFALFTIPGPRPVSIDIVPRVALYRNEFRVRVHVPHDDRNRLLTVTVNGPDMLQWSDTLAGSAAPTVFQRYLGTYRPLAPGRYTISARLDRNDNTHELDGTTFRVIGSTEGEEQ